MTPDELASQELAKWRENENKHQLEMIKKSELDLLSCAKSYVLKTHKGEEVMEGRETDMIDIDKNISVEDVVTALNNSAVSSTSEFLDSNAAHQQSAAEREIAYVKSYQHQASTSSNLSTTSSNSKKKKDKMESHRSRSRESDHHGHDKSKSSSSSSKHKTSRKRSRERSRERDEQHKKSHDRRKDEKHNSSREKEKKHHHQEKSAEKVVRSSTAGGHQQSGVEEKPTAKIIKLAKPKQEDYNLIDQILESSSTLPKLTEDEKEVTTPVTPETNVYKPMGGAPFVESDQEPTSTVMIPTPPHTAFEADDDNG
jgi:hypothetical protein